MNKDIEQRIAWINERVPLDGLRISYIKLQMQEHTKLLIDEIAELKKQVEYQKSGYITLKEYLKTDDILGSIMKLKSELKASKSEDNEAVEFMDWVIKNEYYYNGEYWYKDFAKDKLTTIELYETFKTRNNK